MALLTGAWQKVLREYNGEQAYQAMRKVLTSPGVPYTCGGSFPQGIAGDRHMAAYMKLGYVPRRMAPPHPRWSMPTTMRALPFWHARWATRMTRQCSPKRAENWQNILSPTTHYAQRRRADGSWIEPNDLYRFGTTGG